MIRFKVLCLQCIYYEILTIFVHKFPVLVFQSGIVGFLEAVLMPVVGAIFAVLERPADANDQVASTERRQLRRGYFQLLATIVTNDGLQVFKQQGEQLAAI